MVRLCSTSRPGVRGLVIGNGALEFSARFGGVPMQVFIPLQAVMAVYAKENGEGMVFGSEPGSPDPEGPEGKDGDNTGDNGQNGERPSGRPTLKVVK